MNKEPETMFNLFTKPQVDADNLTVFEHMKQLGNKEGSQEISEAGEAAGVFAQYMKGATFMIPCMPSPLSIGMPLASVLAL